MDISKDHPHLTDADLNDLKRAFLASAELAVAAGFDGVDVKACHGYMVSELLAARDRPGVYGGSFENRTRFLRETVAAIRAAHPDRLVACRLGDYDGADFSGRIRRIAR